MTEFPLYGLPAEHREVREAIRSLCDNKIAPYAAEVDEEARFHAPHVPEAYGGVGADALATVIVIEEVARACAASSLIPAVNKLGSLPLLLSASEEVKQKFLPPVASGDAMFSYALSEPEAGSDAAAMKT